MNIQQERQELMKRVEAGTVSPATYWKELKKTWKAMSFAEKEEERSFLEKDLSVLPTYNPSK